jgi:hypothetical protein
VAVFDFNNDSNWDIAIANQGSNTVRILLGNGNGTFQSAQDFGLGILPTGMAVADFNGDSWNDIAVVDVSSNKVSILINLH